MEVGEPFRPFKKFHGVSVPEALCCYTGISAGPKLCWGRLARYQGRTGEAYPSTHVLADELGVSERQARLYVAELERQGFLRREPVTGTTNRFVFLWHAIFEEPRKNVAAPLRKDSSAPPRNASSDPGGKILPPKRVSEVSRRQESHFEESQSSLDRRKQENDDEVRPVYASEKDELIALIRDSTGEQPDKKLVRKVADFLELRNGTLRQYLDDIRPRLTRLRQRPRAAFFYRHAEQWGGESSRPAAEPSKNESARGPCSCKGGFVQSQEGNREACQNCDLGRDLARANARIARERSEAQNGTEAGQAA